MNKKLERLVLLIGILRTSSVDQELMMKYLEELQAGVAYLVKDLRKNPSHFTAAELVIMDWVQSVMVGIDRIQKINDDFDTDNARAGVA